MMFRIRCPRIEIERHLEFFECILISEMILVNDLLRGFAFFFGGYCNSNAMLIRTTNIENGIA